MEESGNRTAPRRKRLKSIGKAAAISVAVAGVFAIGFLSGQGRIAIGRDTVFNKTQNAGLPADLDYTSVEEVYDSLKRSFDGDLSREELLDGLKQGLASASGDPYTEYLNEEAEEDFNEALNGSFTGIGAELGKDGPNIVIVAPIAGYPAEKAGLQAKDIIAEIDGEPAYDLSITEAVKKIRGPADTQVKLTVIRNNSRELEFEITRAQITIPSVKHEVIEGNIGYLQISRYSEDTAKLAADAAREFKSKGVKGVILDLRNNPGGLLDAAVDVSSLWLKNKKVLDEKRSEVIVRTYRSRGTPLLEGMPTVVLINEGSASASEITAGALKDHGAATLIGQKTFGKGSVQQIDQLNSGGALKVTIARWFTPNGRNIDKEGIEPDETVEINEDDIKNSVDTQKNAAIEFFN